MFLHHPTQLLCPVPPTVMECLPTLVECGHQMHSIARNSAVVCIDTWREDGPVTATVPGCRCMAGYRPSVSAIASAGLGRHRSASAGIGRHRSASAGIGRHRSASAGLTRVGTGRHCFAVVRLSVSDGPLFVKQTYGISYGCCLCLHYFFSRQAPFFLNGDNDLCLF